MKVKATCILYFVFSKCFLFPLSVHLLCSKRQKEETGTVVLIFIFKGHLCRIKRSPREGIYIYSVLIQWFWQTILGQPGNSTPFNMLIKNVIQSSYILIKNYNTILLHTICIIFEIFSQYFPGKERISWGINFVTGLLMEIHEIIISYIKNLYLLVISKCKLVIMKSLSHWVMSSVLTNKIF